MKLVIQIPCFNEAETLPLVLREIPTSLPGISTIETLVVDDGSNDKTSEIATSLGVTQVVRNTTNLGLAFTFRRGIDTALKMGADIIVNIDGDHQYRPSDIGALIAPILEKRADMVVGDRQTHQIADFSPLKKLLQYLGSAVIRSLSHTNVTDTTSGFRAFSRDAARKLTVLSNFTYTHETILQAHSKGLCIANVPVNVNPKTRESRLFGSIRTYLTFSAATILRVFAMYNPLRIFLDTGFLFILVGSSFIVRFVYYYAMGEGSGKIQSLIFAAICIVAGVVTIFAGILADLIQFSRRIQEEILERVKRLEENKE